MATGAAEGLLRCVFSAAIGATDSEIRKRPYHKDCGCALHGARGCSRPSTCNHISYTSRDCWSGSSLGLSITERPDRFTSREIEENYAVALQEKGAFVPATFMKVKKMHLQVRNICEGHKKSTQNVIVCDDVRC